jgi:RNA polymerase sigma factor for flagellar operon FliA
MDVMDYYGLVVALSRRVHQRLAGAGIAVELDDLIQEGSLGLLAAARRFDAGRGVDFATFAYPRIRGSIEDWLRHLDPLSQQERRQVKEVGESRRRRGHELGREPNAHEIAVDFGDDEVSVEKVGRLADLVREALDPLHTVDEVVIQAGAQHDAGLERQQLGDHVEECLEHAVSLTERRTVLLRFWRGLTLERVSQLLGRPLQTIGQFSRSQILRILVQDFLAKPAKQQKALLMKRLFSEAPGAP